MIDHGIILVNLLRWAVIDKFFCWLIVPVLPLWHFAIHVHKYTFIVWTFTKIFWSKKDFLIHCKSSWRATATDVFSQPRWYHIPIDSIPRRCRWVNHFHIYKSTNSVCQSHSVYSTCPNAHAEISLGIFWVDITYMMGCSISPFLRFYGVLALFFEVYLAMEVGHPKPLVLSQCAGLPVCLLLLFSHLRLVRKDEYCFCFVLDTRFKFVFRISIHSKACNSQSRNIQEASFQPINGKRFWTPDYSAIKQLGLLTN